MKPLMTLFIEAAIMVFLIVTISYTLAGFVKHYDDCLCPKCEREYYLQREKDNR